MWTPVIFFAFIVTIANAQPSSNAITDPCLANFDKFYRGCFLNNGNFQLEIVYSVVSNGTSGPLPPNVNKDQVTQQLCANFDAISKCITPIPAGMMQNSQQSQCTTPEQGASMDASVSQIKAAINVMCGGSPEMPPCLSNFDGKFRQCMSQNKIVPDQYFKFLANSTEGLQMTFQQLNASICPQSTTIVQCAATSIQMLKTDCTKEEQFMVAQTIQNMMAAFKALCSGGPPPAPPGALSPCLQNFEALIDKCSQKFLGINSSLLMDTIGKAMTKGVPEDQINKTICANTKNVEKCGRDAIKQAECKGRDMLIVEGSFANLFISQGAYCRDTSMPGACMLSLQSDFTKCFKEVGLNKEDYVGEVSAHKGALIGYNRESAQAYCDKRQDLYVCMKQILHSCPGAEQTMTMTGFDLMSMERAVTLLCSDIDEYLAGLACFEKPSPQSNKCIDDMGQAITTMSAQEMTKGLSLDSFVNSFCEIRIKHVQCDSQAWPQCERPAVQLKRKFECHLLPTNCHKKHAQQLDDICPENAVVAPHLCVDDMRANLAQCIAPYGIDPELFLVNVTHDRTAILKDKNTAARFCQKRLEVYKCMSTTIDSCLGAIEILEKWGHQQNQLQNAINMACNDLNAYEAALQCVPKIKSSIEGCLSKSQQSMGSIDETNLANPVYFKQFCSIRYDQLMCEVNAIQGNCPKAAIGFKTEFECSLVPDRCLASHGSSFKKVCNENNYNRNDRSPTTNNNNGGGSSGSGGSSSGNNNVGNANQNTGTSDGQRGDAATIVYTSWTILAGVAIFFLL